MEIVLHTNSLSYSAASSCTGVDPKHIPQSTFGYHLCLRVCFPRRRPYYASLPWGCEWQQLGHPFQTSLAPTQQERCALASQMYHKVSLAAEELNRFSD